MSSPHSAFGFGRGRDSESHAVNERTLYFTKFVVNRNDALQFTSPIMSFDATVDRKLFMFIDHWVIRTHDIASDRNMLVYVIRFRISFETPMLLTFFSLMCRVCTPISCILLYNHCHYGFLFYVFLVLRTGFPSVYSPNVHLSVLSTSTGSPIYFA